MIKYSLVSKNVINSQTKILIEKKSLIDIDKFVFNRFKSLTEIRDYYKLTNDDVPSIVYKSRNISRFIELIFKDNYNYFLSSIMETTKGSNIDMRNCQFLLFITSFMKHTDIKQLEYLFDNYYINLNIYNEGIAFCAAPYDEYDYFYNFFKYHLSNYLAFRKLFVGLSHYKEKRTIYFDNEKKPISTSDELLNQLYNDDGLDAVYGVYDLDELMAIDGIEQLNIDGFSKKIGKK